MKRLVLLMVLIFMTVNALADSTTNVPVDDPVYRDIDKLIAFGLVKDVIYGQRPWSRREIARIISVADTRSGKATNSSVKILTRLKKEYREELVENGNIEGQATTINLHPLDAARLDYTLLDSPFRAVPNGYGEIDAVTNPFIAYHEGRHFVDGNTLGLETTHRAKLSKYFSLYARPRFEVLIPKDEINDVNIDAQQLYGKWAYKNFKIEVGRDSLIWGQGEYGGLILSNNARPMDMVSLGTDSPFILPWFLKYLGPTSFKVFFANLGSRSDFNNIILSGYKWSILPVSFFELGLNHVVMMGGDGTTGPGFFEAIGEFTGFLSAATGNKRITNIFTNRLFSVEGRLTLPPLRNAIVYSEVAFDDSSSNVRLLLSQDATYFAGFYFPRLTDDGTTDLRIEYKHIPGVTYRHGQYTSGFTLNKRVIGDELGPDSDGVSAKLGWEVNDRFTLTSSLFYERRHNDQFAVVSNGTNIIDIFKLTNNPSENRIRWVCGLRAPIRKDMTAQILTGYEFIKNFNFDISQNRNNFISSLSVTFSPSSSLNIP